MFVQVNYQLPTKGDSEGIIVLRIGIAKIPPSTWLKSPRPSMWKHGDKVELNLTEIGLSLTLDQAQGLVDVLDGFVVRNELPEESVRFAFQGDNLFEGLSLSELAGKLVAYVRRPNCSSVRLPVEALITRAKSSRGKSAINIALEAPRQDEDDAWKAEVSLDSTETHLLSSIILKNIVLAKATLRSRQIEREV